MQYKLDFLKKALKDLNKIDVKAKKRIVDWLNNNLDGCENPKELGKELTGKRTGQWSYRVGDYRAIAEIHEDKILVLVVKIGHRKNVYD